MANRRSNNEGSVYQRGDGMWCAAIQTGWNAEGKPTRVYRYGKTKTAVLEKKRDLEATLRKNLPPPDEKLTVGQLVEVWLHGIDGTVKANTLNGYQTIARRHLREGALSGIRIAELDWSHVTAFLQAKTRAGYKPRTIKAIRGCLVRMLNFAMARNMVHRNVAALVRGPHVPDSADRFFTLEEAGVFLRAIVGHKWEALFYFYLSYGLRLGEGLGFAWSDLDLDNARLSLTMQIQRVYDDPLAEDERRSKLQRVPVKTDGSKRMLPLTVDAIAALRAHRARIEQWHAENGLSWDNDALMFLSAVNTPLEARNVARELKKVCKDAGLGDWHPHDLRHSAASLLLAQNVPIEQITEILGHSSIQITKDLYAHMAEGQKRAGSEVLERALRAAKNGESAAPSEQGAKPRTPRPAPGARRQRRRATKPARRR